MPRAAAARSNPRSLASVLHPSLDNTHAKLFGKWFPQIIPLGTQHTLSLGTIFSPLHQAPRFSHTLRALGPKAHAASQIFLRAAEAALGVSFNAQSQAPDIPGISLRNALSLYCGSFNAQSKAPDIPSPSLRASIQELSASFNAQDQAPDDPCHIHVPQCAPRDWFSTPSPFSQVFPRLPIWLSTVPCQVSFDLPPSAHHYPVRIPITGLQPFLRLHTTVGEVVLPLVLMGIYITPLA